MSNIETEDGVVHASSGQSLVREVWFTRCDQEVVIGDREAWARSMLLARHVARRVTCLLCAGA